MGTAVLPLLLRLAREFGFAPLTRRGSFGLSASNFAGAPSASGPPTRPLTMSSTEARHRKTATPTRTSPRVSARSMPAGAIQSSSSSSRSTSSKGQHHPLRTQDPDDDDDTATERTHLTDPPVASAVSSASASGWLDSPVHGVVHAGMGEAIELTHQDQDVRTREGHKNGTLPGEADGPTVRDEMPSMILLVALYTLQGVPLGLCLGSIPFLLQQHVSYTELGLFTFASWPYSLKLLWSPLVDCWYSNALGRRKSWIVPIQFIIGFMLIALSYYIDQWIQTGAIREMTIACFILIMFVATQDIAVDGWAISLLSKKNVGYASTCQSIGQNIGFFASYTIFLALNHAEFCNKFRSVPSTEGFLTLPGFMWFWGVAFIGCTLYLLLFRPEAPYVPEEGEDMGLRSIYEKMWRIIKLKRQSRSSEACCDVLVGSSSRR